MADYNTLQRRRNIIVGAFVVIAFCGLCYMLYIFGEFPSFISDLRSYKIKVNFADAPGVQDNTPVQYCGYQIGSVINVAPPFLYKDPETGQRYHQVKVTIAIERKYVDIPSNIDVLLLKRGLGSSYIVFEFDPEQQIAGFLKQGDVLQGKMGTSTEFIPKAVQEKLENLVDSVSDLTRHANDIVGDQGNKDNIKKTLANLTTATGQATDTLRSVQDLAVSGKGDLSNIAESMNSTLADIRVLLRKINEGQGTAGRIVNDAELYENLVESTLELQMMLEQIKMFAADSREKGLKIKW